MDLVSTEDQGEVRILRIERPEVRNCIDAATAVALRNEIEAFRDDRDARVLIVTGRGEEAFSSGADLVATEPLIERAQRGEHPLGFADLDAGKPTIAAISGYCIAGGMELAAWCDFRIADETAKFGGRNRNWGIPFIDGGSQRFPRILGAGRAMYVLLAGVDFDAARAYELGFVEEVVEKGRVLARALEIARYVASAPWPTVIADRTSILEGGVSEEGLAGELARGVDALGEAGITDRLEGFRRGERPEPPRALGIEGKG